MLVGFRKHPEIIYDIAFIPVAGSFKHSYEPLGSMKGGEFLN